MKTRREFLLKSSRVSLWLSYETFYGGLSNYVRLVRGFKLKSEYVATIDEDALMEAVTIGSPYLKNGEIYVTAKVDEEHAKQSVRISDQYGNVYTMKEFEQMYGGEQEQA